MSSEACASATVGDKLAAVGGSHKKQKIIDKIRDAVEVGTVFYSFEFFPPKTDAGVENLYDRLVRMHALNPAFVDITWGAGGSTSELTLEITDTIQNMVGMECQMHLTCTNMPLESIVNALEVCKEKGIRNILALRGDPPAGAERWTATEGGFEHGVDLVRFIRERFGDYFCICVAGYPEGHIDCESYEQDLQHLKEKVDAGADYIITQLFYDVDVFLKFVEDCRNIGIAVPIIPGIMPIMNYGSFRRMTGFCKTLVPKEIEDILEPIKEDDEAVKEAGVQIGVQMCQKLLKNGIRGLHFYTLNLEKTVTEILKGLDLIPKQKRSFPWRPALTSGRDVEDVRPIYWSNRPHSYLARTADWDEFPNGRWGDSRSPAYGDLSDHYLCRASVSETKRTERLAQWGENPETIQDLQEVFVKHVRGEVDSIPWNSGPFSSETKHIIAELETLNRQGFWTINSQPRVNAASSEDPNVGWGGPGGVVYQKAYIEFFCSEEKFQALEAAIQKFPSISFQATTSAGQMFSNFSTVTAVTWGVFPAKEILQPTVVDPTSFLVWKDEAFALWKDWGNLYGVESEARKLVDKVHDSFYLVTLVDNDFIHGDIFKVFESL